MAAPVYISWSVYKSSFFSTSLPTLVIFRFFDHRHPDLCEVIAYGGFDLHFPDNSFIEHLFVHWLAIWISSSEKCLFSSFAHFCFGVVEVFLVYFGY